MNSYVHPDASGTEGGWTRVSSFKPQLAGVAAIAAFAASLLVLLREYAAVFPLIVGITLIALGLLALNCKVVRRRGKDYRISTLFYTEVVRVDDVCMTVTNPGPLWTRFRIHLRRPARFGWMVSFVPADEAHWNNAGTLGSTRA